MVDMLEALPPEEHEYDAHEDNVLDWCGKSAELFHEIQERYSLMGGAWEEYVSYVGRDDLPDYMWSFTCRGSQSSCRLLSGSAKEQS